MDRFTDDQLDILHSLLELIAPNIISIISNDEYEEIDKMRKKLRDYFNYKEWDD